MADTLTLPKPDEAKVAELMRGAFVGDEAVTLSDGAPVDVFEAARRLGFEGILKVVRGTRYVRVYRDAATWDRL